MTSWKSRFGRQTPASFRDGLEPRSTDVFIAVMGVTGAGKSTFISKCCNRTIPIGHSLQGCTTTVDVYPYQINPNTTVYLIDTPGFDDTNRSDDEVLREIATWMTDSYTHEIRLSGIIYLHRISDVRMQGSAKKNLFMFKKLCGPNALKNVILATTMWDRVTEAEGCAREQELTSTSEFWGWMVSQGSRVYRHGGDKTSALQLIYTLVQDNSEVTLALQQQMANENKSLEETDVGIELRSEILKEREKFEKRLAEVQRQTAEALKERDEESAKMLKEVQNDYKDRIKQLERSAKQLKIDMEDLHKEKYQRIELKLQEMQNRHEEERRQMQEDHSRKEVELSKATEQREAAIFSRLENLIIQEMPKKGTPTHINGKSSTRKTTNIVPKHEVSLAIAGNSFFFNGPKSTVGNGLPLSHVTKHPSDSDLRILALGDNESWVSIDHSGNLEWANLENNYPRFIAHWKGKDWGRIPHLVLGSNGYYLMISKKRYSWKLGKDMMSYIDIDKNWKRIEVCALGRYGSYIVQLGDGNAFWDLKGCYGELGKWILQKSKDEDLSIRAAVLSLTNDDFIVVYEDGSAWVSTNKTYLKRWQEWVTEHYNTVF